MIVRSSPTGLLLCCAYLILLPLVTHTHFVVRVRRDLHQRHDHDAEETAEDQSDDETDHFHSSFFINYENQ